MKYYVIAEFPYKENELHLADDRQSAEALVGNISKSITDVLNSHHLTVTTKEDDTIIKWDGKLMTTLKIRAEDEVEVTETKG